MRTQVLRISLLLLSFLLLPTLTEAQASEITEAEYWAAVRSAFAATRNAFPRREIEKYEGAPAGRKYSRTKTSEYSSADTFHLITETTDGERRTVEELMRIGAVSYCKNKSDVWDTKNCYENPPAALETAIEASFRVETSAKGTTYFRKTSYLFQETGKPEKTKFQSEDLLVLNPDMTVRERTITNSSKETGAIQSTRSLKHEYGIKLKPIKAPVE